MQVRWAADSGDALGELSLPHGMPDGLHMVEPSSWPWWPFVLAALALWWWWRRRRRPQVASPPPAPIEPPAPRPEVSNVIGQIAELRRRHRVTEDFRRGCHELAHTIRAHLHGAEGIARPAALTARELEERYDESIGKLMVLIANLQWRRRRPEKEEFERACNVAVDVLSVTRGRKL